MSTPSPQCGECSSSITSPPSYVDLLLVMDDSTLTQDLKTVLANKANHSKFFVCPAVRLTTALAGGKKAPSATAQMSDSTGDNLYQLVGAQGQKKWKGSGKYTTWTPDATTTDLTTDSWKSKNVVLSSLPGSSGAGNPSTAGTTALSTGWNGGKSFTNTLTVGDSTIPIVDPRCFDSWVLNLTSEESEYVGKTDAEIKAMTVVDAKTGAGSEKKIRVRAGDVGTFFYPPTVDRLTTLKADNATTYNRLAVPLSDFCACKYQLADGTELDAYFHRMNVGPEALYGDKVTADAVSSATPPENAPYLSFAPGMVVKAVQAVAFKLTSDLATELWGADDPRVTSSEHLIGGTPVTSSNFSSCRSSAAVDDGDAVCCSGDPQEKSSGWTTTEYCPAAASTSTSNLDVAEGSPTPTPEAFAAGSALRQQSVSSLTSKDQVGCALSGILVNNNPMRTNCGIFVTGDKPLAITMRIGGSPYVTDVSEFAWGLNLTDPESIPTSHEKFGLVAGLGASSDEGAHKTNSSSVVNADGARSKQSPCGLFASGCVVKTKDKFPAWAIALIVIGIAAVIVGVAFLGKAIHDRKVHPTGFKATSFAALGIDSPAF